MCEDDFLLVWISSDGTPVVAECKGPALDRLIDQKLVAIIGLERGDRGRLWVTQAGWARLEGRRFRGPDAGL